MCVCVWWKHVLMVPINVPLVTFRGQPRYIPPGLVTIMFFYVILLPTYKYYYRNGYGVGGGGFAVRITPDRRAQLFILSYKQTFVSTKRDTPPPHPRIVIRLPIGLTR